MGWDLLAMLAVNSKHQPTQSPLEKEGNKSEIRILWGDVILCRSSAWPHARVYSQSGHLQLLWVTVVTCWHFEGLVLEDEMSCVLEDPTYLQGIWDLYKYTVLEMSKGNQAETHSQCLTETSYDYIMLEMLNFSYSCKNFFE